MTTAISSSPALASVRRAVVPTATVGLTELGVGQEAWLAPSDLPPGDRQLLRALGLIAGRKVRLCKVGSPWIVEVRGIRIGLSPAVARHLRVHTHAGETHAPSR